MDVTTTFKPDTTFTSKSDVVSNPDAILGKDDFMKLLLTELQYQDPTNPMDSEKMLTQTSQLATLEASDNTNKALEKLAATLTQSSSLAIVSAIGKMASLSNEGFVLDENNTPTFDIYLPENISSGTIQIEDTQGNVVRTIPVDAMGAGIHTFSWDGTDGAGNRLNEGSYRAMLSYMTSDGQKGYSRTGSYPIEAVRFDKGEALLKVGNRYLPMDEIGEIYGG
ncbi:FlgD immunoglobulin-like domain containing protein [Hydrogenimonas urashimensis]|uniref:FlgD immunoglobulin-like domain containing protein n=1 Tax=Hydrogenimonas urashimensis TaxID=2740515 RepID=UPI00191566BE|nr:FlgD immunoglobulin-like domain containing protein [Hydrogenimonas urashimensis]